MAKGGGEQSTATTPHQQKYYDQLLRGAENAFFNGGFFDEQISGGEATRAGLDPQQRQMYERITGPQGSLDLALGGLEKQLGAYDPNNAALTGAIDMAAADVTRNLQENLLPGIGDSAGQAGQFGSTRHGIAEGLALRGASEQVGDIATQMRLQDMQAHQAGQQSALQNLGAITSGLEYTGAGMQRDEQGRLDDLFRRWEYESGVPLQNLQAFKGLISGDMGGTQAGETEGGK